MRRLLIILAAALSFLAQASDYTLSGVACQTLNANTSKFGWKPEGAANKDSFGDRWAICPIMKNNNDTQLSITVGLLNEGNRDRDVQCRLRQRVDGRQTASAAGTVSVQGASFSKEMFFEGTFDEDASLTVQCLLPPSMIIEYVRSESTGGSGGSGGSNPSADVIACVTSPLTSYGSSAATVEMKNGMQLNNYDGRSWSSSESHLTFRTQSERWYTIEDYEDIFAELYRLDVIQEPNSCFEPEADRFESPSRVEAFNGEKRLYVQGGYIVVGSTCGVTTSSVLTIFNTGGNASQEYYIVDINTGEDCRIRDAVET